CYRSPVGARHPRGFFPLAGLPPPPSFVSVLWGYLGFPDSPSSPPVVVISIPVPVPAFASPVAPAPARELSPVNRATLAIFEHPLTPVRPARIDAQRLDVSRIRIHAKRAVTHPERPVRL